MSYRDPDKHRAYQRAWNAGHRAVYLAGRACLNCGSTERLEIHHRNPAEKVCHRIWSWSPERRAVELAKCDVLCHVCHAQETAARFQQHGTVRRYRSGCRCGACIDGYRTGRRAERARRQARQRETLPLAA